MLAILIVSSKFGLTLVPSLFISVKINLLIPNSFTSFKKSTIFTFKFSVQPETERFPSLASSPKAILLLNFVQASLRNSLFFIAALPKITFSTPASI